MIAASLLELYHVASKHSNYQSLPAQLQHVLSSDDISVKSRHEGARLAYILSRVDVAGLRVADIGGNTGFFSLELLGHGARAVDYFEGNAAHHDFVQAAAAELGFSGSLRTHHGYVGFEHGELPEVDCTVLLNVLHHLGDDFGDAGLAMEAAKARILECLATLSRSSRLLVFQLGFNWKGDRHQPLFPRGTKAEMIDFVTRGTAADWTIDAIGIAARHGDSVRFDDLSDTNIARDDSLGEFLNRPIFIMRSRHSTGTASCARNETCVVRGSTQGTQA
jgi:hypothetical protein